MMTSRKIGTWAALRRLVTVGHAIAVLLLAIAVVNPGPASAQVIGIAGRAAARAAAHSSERRAVSQAAMQQARVRAVVTPARRAGRVQALPCLATRNKCAGLRREATAQRKLARAYPGERVQTETYLLNRSGTRAVDPHTGKGRRIDVVMFKGNRVTRRYEVTSLNADKRAQLAREQRILTLQHNGRKRTGPAYVRNRATDRLVPVKSQPSKLLRLP